MMKNIKDFYPDKYCSGDYEMADNGIYKVEDTYYTSLSFEQEPEFGESESAADISQHPLEEILKSFGVYIQDFYEDYNLLDSNTAQLEFAGSLQSIKKLRELIGKHVYVNNSNELIIE